MVALISSSVAWLVLRGSWHPRGHLASCSLDLDQWDGHLGFQMSRGGIYGGISQLALAPTVTFILQSGVSEPAAWCQLPIYPHISAWVSASVWHRRKSIRSSCRKLDHCASWKLGELRRQQMLMKVWDSWWSWRNRIFSKDVGGLKNIFLKMLQPGRSGD